MNFPRAAEPTNFSFRRAGFEDLPPPPSFRAAPQLTHSGVVLGEGVVLAPLASDGGLVLSGRETDLFILLSLAQGRAASPNAIHGFGGVSKSLRDGDVALAAIRLAQIGLPALRDERDAELLRVGARCLAKGHSPWEILHAAGIEGENIRLF